MKTCFACGVEKPRTEFWRHSQKKDGLHPRCKDCQRPFQRKYKVKHLYGVTDEASLGDTCEICGAGSNLNIDHDHQSGLVRGLLCWNCNTALGKFYDSPALLGRAIMYLEKHGTRTGRMSSGAATE